MPRSREPLPPRSREPLPPPLPPETRTVGQLVAETIHLYRRRFWPGLAVGLGPAVVDAVTVQLPRAWQIAFVPIGGAVLLTAAYVGAAVVVAERRPPRRALVSAFVAGVLVFIPFPFLAFAFVLPGLAWLALFGLAVPVAVFEETGVRRSLTRALALARADFVHVLGGLATLVVAVFLTRAVLFLLLQGVADAAVYTAAFLADVVISPLLLLGACLLYGDQKARLESATRPQKTRRRNADLHPAQQPDRTRGADPPLEPGAPAGGEP